MVVIPNSRIRLLKSPIELDERNQLTFSSLQAQTDYFMSLPYLEYDECTYNRKDGVIRFETDTTGITYEDLLGYNYCMYQNSSYSNKWFYAFITEITYKNDGCTELKIETDVIESWKFEINYKPSFIEREHVNDDTLGKNTYPEALETGEYTEVGIDHYTELDDTCTVIGSTIRPDSMDNILGGFTGEKFEGVAYYIFMGLSAFSYNHADQASVLNAVINRFNSAGKISAISSVFMAPQKLVGWSTGATWTTITGTTITYRQATGTGTLNDFSINKPTSIGSYTPKNNKVLCFPYNFLSLTNNNGNNAIYHYEDFTYDPSTPNTFKFGVKGVLVPGCSIRAIPKNYKGQTEDYSEGLSAGKFPICSWQNDIDTNWLTQQAVNRPIQIVGSGISIAAGAATGNPIGVASGVLGIAQSIGTIYEHSLIPPQAEGDIASGEVGFSLTKNTFEAHKIQIREEYAKIIDKYFSMYGYKVNLLKTPSFESRLNWNYIKTRGLNITGDIPQTDMQKIKEIFDSGITFWHNPSTFLDYSQSNSIVS